MNCFILMGQSNMAGRGKLGDVPEIVNPNCYMWRHGAWQPMKEPLHQDSASAGIGLGASFADWLQKRSGAPIGLIPCAEGGTSLDDWQPGGEVYARTVAAARAALEFGDCKGILWHQGEKDCRTPEQVDAYEDKLLYLFNSLFVELSTGRMHVVVGELGSFLLKQPEMRCVRELNQLLRLLPKAHPFIETVSAEFLGSDDGAHFNAGSLREYGLRYAEGWLRCAKRMGT